MFFKAKLPILVAHKNVINFNRIYEEVLIPVIKAFNVVAICTDRWQNLKILHDLENDFGLEIFQYSLKYDDFTDAKSYIIDENAPLRLPPLEVPEEEIETLSMQDYPHGFKYKPLAHLYYQMLTVRDSGRSVEKGLGATDDIFRAFILCVKHMIDKDWVKEVLDKYNNLNAKGKAALGSYGRLGTGSANGAKNKKLGTVGTTTQGGLGVSTSNFSRQNPNPVNKLPYR